MRVLILTDEPSAQTALADIVAKRPDVEHFDTVHDPIKAMTQLITECYDVLLLDVNMPELFDAEFLCHLRNRADPTPSIVFVTGHVKHAITAFENHAVDYVLKPFSEARVHEALHWAYRRAQGERAAKLLEVLPQLKKLSRPHSPRIAVRAKGKILFVNPVHVTAVMAQGNYILLQQEATSYILRETISGMEERLKPYGFIRIHRSVLVNSSLVEEIKPYLSGEYGLRLRGGREFTVTRTYKHNLGCLADFWIGSSTFLSEENIAREKGNQQHQVQRHQAAMNSWLERA